MFEQLHPLLRKPELFEKTTAAFWTDPHISKGMLSAHLNPNTDAASRKPAFIDQATTWIASLLTPGSSLLDIGCGPGLYTSRLAQYDLRISGLDFSPRSIAYAQEHDTKTMYYCQSYLEMDFEQAFDMITLIWCDYAALVPEDRAELLKRVQRALKPGGRFLFDVFTPVWNAGKKDSTRWVYYADGGFWSPNPHYSLEATYYYENSLVSVDKHVVIEKGREFCIHVWNQIFTKETLETELLDAGFKEVEFFSDVKGAPYRVDAETLCAVASMPS